MPPAVSPHSARDEITVRRSDLADSAERTAVAALLAEYAAALKASLAESPATIVERLRDDGRGFVWLAWEGAVPCGLAIGFRLFSTFAGRPTLNIHDLAVAGEYRGRGVGTLLIETVARDATAMDCAKLTLEVRDDNPAAERLYRRLGFVDPDGASTRFLSRPLP